METLAYIYIAQIYEEAIIKKQQVSKLLQPIEVNVNKTEVELMRAYAELKN
ncbi:MAG: hypothetical protein WBB28_14750 [Crinalium sp.]